MPSRPRAGKSIINLVCEIPSLLLVQTPNFLRDHVVGRDDVQVDLGPVLLRDGTDQSACSPERQGAGDNACGGHSFTGFCAGFHRGLTVGDRPLLILEVDFGGLLLQDAAVVGHVLEAGAHGLAA